MLIIKYAATAIIIIDTNEHIIRIFLFNLPFGFSALNEVGYDSFCTAEMIPPYKYYPYQIIYNTSSSMDAILGRKKFPC